MNEEDERMDKETRHQPDDECEKQVVNIDDKPAFIVHHGKPRK